MQSNRYGITGGKETGIKPYNFHETEEGSVEVEMYGEVVESRLTNWWTGEPEDGLYIVLEEFLNDLNTWKDRDNITFRINSVGGDLYAGIAICNRISELKGNTVTVADALAASAASVILQGGKKRKAFAGSQIMVHGPSTFMFGSYNLHDLETVQKRLTGGCSSVIEIYAERTGKDKDFIQKLVDTEEWMIAQKALENGFIDEVIPINSVSLSLSADRKIILSNGVSFPTEVLPKLPQNITFTKVTSGSEQKPVVIDNSNQKEKGEEIMDKTELKQKYPDLIKEIEEDAGKENRKDSIDEAGIRDEAVRSERERLKEIEKIENQIADKSLVDNAKYGEKPMTAQELAYEAMKQQKVTGENFMRDMKDDSKSSGVNDVEPAPNSGETADELKDIEDGAALIASGT